MKLLRARGRGRHALGGHRPNRHDIVAPIVHHKGIAGRMIHQGVTVHLTQFGVRHGRVRSQGGQNLNLRVRSGLKWQQRRVRCCAGGGNKIVILTNHLCNLASLGMKAGKVGWQEQDSVTRSQGLQGRVNVPAQRRIVQSRCGRANRTKRFRQGGTGCDSHR